MGLIYEVDGDACLFLLFVTEDCDYLKSHDYSALALLLYEAQETHIRIILKPRVHMGWHCFWIIFNFENTVL